MPETKKAAETDKASAEDAARLERDREKMTLLSEIAFLDTQKEVLDGLIEYRKERLKLLMGNDGESARSNDEADASFSTRRSFQVANPEGLVLLFDTPAKAAEILAQNFKPTATFVDSLTEAGKKVDGIITVGLSETFIVARAKTRAAKERQRQIVDESKKAAEERIKALAGQIKGTKKGTK
jgi:hypothetical protein